MSIYATLWVLRFPRLGDYHTGCEWVEVLAQGVPAHIGTPSPGYGYESGDSFGTFLPPPVEVGSPDDEDKLRAVVFVTRGTPKGTERSPQEYVRPLLVMSGAEYASASIGEVVERVAAALRGARPRVLLDARQPDGTTAVMFDDGTTTYVQPLESGDYDTV